MSSDVEKTLEGPGASTTASLLLDSRIVERGEVIGRYEILDEIAQGAMGVVYRARDPELDRVVALKLVHPRRADRMVDRRRLHREARAMARLSHPNVVEVLDTGMTEDGTVFVAMELIDGANLQQWLRRHRQDWRAVLRVLLDAARGIAAAHRAGIVHRDLKPENVMIGLDAAGRAETVGRVRVLDFGLARTSEQATDDDALETSASPTHDGPPSVDPSRETADGRLTRTGAALGTPAYMAPEQHLGGHVDARTDQFAFCVTLFEALHGYRPFAGKRIAEVRNAVCNGRVESAPRDTPVPRRINEAIIRGLATKPEERWPDMESLIEVLQTAASTTGSRIRLAALAGLSAVGAGAWFIADGPGPSVCETQGELSGVWDPQRREALQSSLGAASNVTQAVTSELDAYATRWRTAFAEVCSRGSTDDPADDPAHFDRALACLQDRRRALKTWVEVLGTADEAGASSLATERITLPAVEVCLGEARSPYAPRDPEQAKRLGEARARLSRAQALLSLGRTTESLELSTAVLREAEQIGNTPLLVQAQLQVGMTKRQAAEFDDAIARLEQAFHGASDIDAADTAAQSALHLATILGGELGRPTEALEWSDHAHSWAERADDERVRAMVDRSRGDIHLKGGNLPEAEAAYRAGLARWTKLGATDSYEATVVATSLATALVMRGELSESQSLLEQALQDRLRTHGPDFPRNAQIHNVMGYVHLRRAQWEDARAQFGRALDLWRTSLPESHPNIAAGLNNVAEAQMALQDWDAAADSFAQALQIAEGTLGKAHPQVAMVRANLAEARRQQDRLAQAEALARQAVDDFEQAAGPDHPELAHPLTTLGAVRVDLGQADLAIDPLRRALALLAKAPDPHRSATAHFELARALLADGDPSGAREHGLAAQQAYQAAPETSQDDRNRVADWLAALP